MDNVMAARALMGISLGFHIIYATIGVGLPFLLMLAEYRALATGNEVYHQMARRWIRPAGVLFAIGAVSGTILSFELGFLWPRFMAFSGPMIGLPFWMEGFAFFTEAIFLALYAYGYRRLSRRALFLCTIPFALAAGTSAVFVISANAWMNTPTGFNVVAGAVTDVNPVGALFNPAWAHEAVHGTLAAYVATSFALAGVYAWALLHGREKAYSLRALKLVLTCAAATLPLMLLSGDWAAAFIARHEKPKLAAAEAMFKTTAGAPLIIGGWPDPGTGTVRFGLEIPKLLSLLAFHDTGATVEGLDAFPPDRVPDPRLVHPFFDLMVGSFFIMTAALAWFGWENVRRPGLPGKWPLRALLLASPFGIVALESGWLVTEFGRQPWVVQEFMRVQEGATQNGGIGTVFMTFLIVYLALTAGLLKLLLPRRGKGTGERSGDVHP